MVLHPHRFDIKFSILFSSVTSSVLFSRSTEGSLTSVGGTPGLGVEDVLGWKQELEEQGVQSSVKAIPQMHTVL